MRISILAAVSAYVFSVCSQAIAAAGADSLDIASRDTAYAAADA